MVILKNDVESLVGRINRLSTLAAIAGQTDDEATLESVLRDLEYAEDKLLMYLKRNEKHADTTCTAR